MHPGHPVDDTQSVHTCCAASESLFRSLTSSESPSSDAASPPPLSPAAAVDSFSPDGLSSPWEIKGGLVKGTFLERQREKEKVGSASQSEWNVMKFNSL